MISPALAGQIKRDLYDGLDRRALARMFPWDTWTAPKWLWNDGPSWETKHLRGVVHGRFEFVRSNYVSGEIPWK